jgi:hypothetical protein
MVGSATVKKEDSLELERVTRVNADRNTIPPNPTFIQTTLHKTSMHNLSGTEQGHQNYSIFQAMHNPYTLCSSRKCSHRGKKKTLLFQQLNNEILQAGIKPTRSNNCKLLCDILLHRAQTSPVAKLTL